MKQLKNSNSRNYFDWPVDRARLTQKFKPRSHLGIDLAHRTGTAIYAAHDGWVIYTGAHFSGFGKLIIIEGSQGWSSLYGHLNRIRVHQGVYIKKGARIGDMGNTGRSSGPHLHFEIRKNKKPQNPLSLLP